MNSKIKIGIVGSSRMAQMHLEVLKSFRDVKLLAISSTKKGTKRRELIREKFNILHSYDDYKVMIKENNFDAIFVSSSVETIYPISKYLLKEKINLFIEKPPGLSIAEVKELSYIARVNKLITMVGFQKSFYGIFNKAKKYIKENGGLSSIVIEAPEHFGALKSKGKFSKKVLKKWIYANSIHCINLFIFFAGDVKKINTVSKKMYEKLHPDSINSLLYFKNGIAGHYISNWMSPGNYSVTLYGKNFKIIFSPLEKGKIIFSSGDEKNFSIPKKDTKYKPGLYDQNRYFIDCIKKTKKPERNDINESLKSMLLAKKIANI